MNVSKITLRKWHKEGVLVPLTTTGKHRRYDFEKIKNFYETSSDKTNKLTIGYCRVSTHDQKNDLETQISKVDNFCSSKGYCFKIISDIGSGLNYNKTGLNELINLILEDKIERIVINYKDRLIRYGYEIIEILCKKHNVEIIIINQTEDKTYEQELIEDVLEIITVLSDQLYGQGSRKSKTISNETKKLFSS